MDETPELEAPEVYPFPSQKPRRDIRVIESQWPSKCAACSGTIRVGDFITPQDSRSYGRTKWIHVECY